MDIHDATPLCDNASDTDSSSSEHSPIAPANGVDTVRYHGTGVRRGEPPRWKRRVIKFLTRASIEMPYAVFVWVAVLCVPLGLCYRYYQSPPKIIVSLNSFHIPDDPIGRVYDGVRAADHNCDTQCAGVFCPASSGHRQRRNGHNLLQPWPGDESRGVGNRESSIHFKSGGWNDRNVQEETRQGAMSLADFASGVFGGGNARALTAEPFSSASSTQRRDHVEHRGSWPKTRAMVTRRGSGLVISLVYKSLSGNMLTPDGVGLVHAVESELTRFATSRGETVEWQSVCLYAFPPFGRYSDTNASVSMHQIQGGLNMAYDGTHGIPSTPYPPPVGDTIFEFGGTGLSRSGPAGWTSQYVRSQVSTSASEDGTDVAAWVEKLQTVNPDPDAVEFTYAAPSIINYIILSMVHKDLYIAVYALGFVGICMLVHTNSLLLSIFGVVNSVLAFPVGYAIYRELLGHTDLSVLSVSSVFVVLGIAVDDLFVFVDMWRQQHRGVALETRLHNTVRSAAASCLFTTATSAAAFAANTVSAVPALAEFGAFTAAVIVGYFLLLFLLVFPTLSVWWRWVEPVERRCYSALTAPFRLLWARLARKLCPTAAIARSRSLGSAAAGSKHKYATLATNPVFETLACGVDGSKVRDDGTEGGEDADEPLLLLEMEPMAGDGHGSKTGSNGGEPSLDDSGIAVEASVTGLRPQNPQAATLTDHGAPTYLEQVLYSGVGLAVVRGRRWIITAFAIFVIVAITSAAQLDFAKSAPSLVRKDSDVGRVQALADVFPGWESNGGAISRPPSTPTRVSPAPTVSMAPVGPTASTISPTTHAPTQPTAPPPPTPPTALPDVGGDSATANVNVELVMGLASPYVDRSHADITSVTPSFGDYIPHFDPGFNNNVSGYNASVRMDQAVAMQWRTACLSLLSRNHSDSGNTSHSGTSNGPNRGMVGNGEAVGGQWLSVPSDSTVEQLCNCVGCIGGVKYLTCADATSTSPRYTALFTSSSFAATFTSNTGSKTILKSYRGLQSQLEALRREHPAIASVQPTSEEYARASFEVQAIYGAIWGIVLSTMLCVTAIVVFVPHGVVVGIVVGIMVSTITAVLAMFFWSGWRLGGIEAIALSILVGTSVDFLIHMMQAFLKAHPDSPSGLRGRPLLEAHALLRSESAQSKLDADTKQCPPINATLTNRFREWVCGGGMTDRHAESVREWRIRVAMATVGVPISWSAITTAGSAGFLMTCNLVLFRRLGEILVFNTVVGWTFSVLVLPAILSSVGPRPFGWTLRRCIGAVGGLGVAVAGGTLVLYLAWKAHPQAIQNSRGKSLF